MGFSARDLAACENCTYAWRKYLEGWVNEAIVGGLRSWCLGTGVFTKDVRKLMIQDNGWP